MGAVIGTPVAIKSATTATEHLPRGHKATQRFLYKSHPMRWTWHEGREQFVPQLGKMFVDPGVGGVRDGGDISLAVAQAMQAGWTMIDPKVLAAHPDPDVKATAGYCSRFQKEGTGKRGRFYHEDSSASYRKVGHRVFWSPDGDKYWGMVSLWILHGIVPPPEDIVIESRVMAQEERLTSVRNRASANTNNPQMLANQSREEKRLKAMRKGYKALFAAPKADA